MWLTRNPKTLVGGSIILTACAFMIAVYGTLSRVPAPIVAVYLFSLIIGGTLQVRGSIEAKRRALPPAVEITTR